MFGDDFAYTNATVWYSQMDLLIDSINSMNGSQYHAFYSTPECYLRSVHEQWFRRKKGPSESALSYSGDFMPYSDRNFEWWTGYYSNRPQLKYHIRQASNFLQVYTQSIVACCTPWSWVRFPAVHTQQQESAGYRMFKKDIISLILGT
ncbi:lysosomal alpha-mannosidase-like [Rhipicephalus sanguineus]|uniref:lysosomal alpha-mannosidase-like n=1 Tax=Rhipicephalus sanguineus TaxID=34632 RepID=UPI0020C46CAA|nr:lysosomal alpha-mannosidase-like [Rhipicephalus sanguineus]